MITRKQQGQLFVTTQIDHARQSGVLAERWGNDRFARPQHFGSFVYAACEHDEAWRHLDDAPTLNPKTQSMTTFMETPLDVLLPEYLAGAERVGARDPYAGYLVMMHYQGFFQYRFGFDRELPGRDFNKEERAEVHKFLTAADECRERFRANAKENIAATLDPEIISAYLILQVVDAASLFLCLAPDRESALGTVPVSPGGEKIAFSLRPLNPQTVAITPWPFATATPIELRFPVRVIEDRPYSSEESLRAAYSSAHQETVTFSLLAGA